MDDGDFMMGLSGNNVPKKKVGVIRLANNSGGSQQKREKSFSQLNTSNNNDKSYNQIYNQDLD